MNNWIERAEQELCDALNDGSITEKEFNEQMRDLMAEVREGAQEVADAAYDDYYG